MPRELGGLNHLHPKLSGNQFIVNTGTKHITQDVRVRVCVCVCVCEK